MNTERDLVRNAADPQQVRRAAQKADDRDKQRLAIYREVLKHEVGRAVFWDLLGQANVFASIWHPSAQIHYNAGKQDFGHEIMATLIAASPELYLQMEREGRFGIEREQVENAGVHTPSATEEAEDNG